MDNDIKRLSHCSRCGKRLSKQKPSGDIQWQPSQIDDQGIYCDDCYAEVKKNRPIKPAESD